MHFGLGFAERSFFPPLAIARASRPPKGCAEPFELHTEIRSIAVDSLSLLKTKKRSKTAMYFKGSDQRPLAERATVGSDQRPLAERAAVKKERARLQGSKDDGCKQKLATHNTSTTTTTERSQTALFVCDSVESDHKPLCLCFCRER